MKKVPTYFFLEEQDTFNFFNNFTKYMYLQSVTKICAYILHL